MSYFNQNFFEFAEKFQIKKFDACITDPPYGISTGNENITGLKNHKDITLNFGVWDCFESEEAYVDFISKIPIHLKMILKEDSNVLIFCSDTHIGLFQREFKRNGFKFHKVIAWCKTNPMYQIRKRNFISGIEFILHFTLGKYPFYYTKYEDMLNYFICPVCHLIERVKDKKGRILHPTQKPIKLLTWLIPKVTKIGDWIIDPFGGVFSIHYACRILNRKCLTTEINKVYFEAGIERMKQVPLTQSLLNYIVI